MEKRKILRNVTIVGLLFGLAFWICFYSNLIFKNTEPGFTVVPEIFFALMFILFFGMEFYDITKWYIKRKGKNGSRWMMISLFFLNLFVLSSCVFIICVSVGIILKGYLPKNNPLEKMTILWILLNLWPLLVFIGSQKIIQEHNTSES
ncbi:MAG: hypothetical protein AAB334_00915 [Patescibacteria group bacterium]